MTDEEVRIFWDYLIRYRGTKWQCLFGLCLWRGLRLNEACAVNIRDFQDENFTQLNVVLSKSYIIDNFPLLKGFNELLKNYVRDNLQTFKDGYLFPTHSHRAVKNRKHICPKSASAVFCSIRKEIESFHPAFGDKMETKRIEGNARWRYRIGTHSLRRWFITKLFDSGLEWHQIDDIQRYQKKGTCFTYYNSYDTWKKENDFLNSAFKDHWDDFNDQLPGQMKLSAY